MAAGTSYSKRYAGGFVDKPSTASPIDSVLLNAVETALLQIFGQAPTVDGQVAQWDFANTRFGPALLLNKNVDPAAAIASSKLDFTGGNALTNAAIAGAAAISRSKLDFGSGLVNADIATAAAIAQSKLAATFGALVTSLPLTPVDGQLCIITDSTSTPTYFWPLVYVATPAKWYALGGGTPREGTTTVTVPFAGDYYCEMGASGVIAGPSSSPPSLTLTAGSITLVGAGGGNGGGTEGVAYSLSDKGKMVALTAAQVLTPTSLNSPTRPYIRIYPVRIA